jgi:hypothetical protein
MNSTISKLAGGFCALIIAVAMLPGCAHKEEETTVCPATGLVSGAGEYPVIASDVAHPAAADLAVLGVLKLTGACNFKEYRETKKVRMDFALQFSARRGEKGQQLAAQQFPYFIAVLSPDNAVLQRQEFYTSVSFDKTGSGAASEDFTIYLPIAVRAQAPAYKVAVGFKLTPRQVDYNREYHGN